MISERDLGIIIGSLMTGFFVAMFSKAWIVAGFLAIFWVIFVKYARKLDAQRDQT